MKLSDWQFSQRSLRGWLLLAFFLSGACALIYQVVWVRMLGLIFGNTTYAVSTVLCAFMAGLALGSYYLGRYIDYKGKPLLVYSFLEAGIGLYCLFVPLLFAGLQWGYVGFYRIFEPSQFAVNLFRFASAFVIMLIPTILMGGTLPVLSKFFVQSREELGRDVGMLYSINTWGAVLGTFAAGFFLILALGVKGTLYAAAIVNLVIAGFVYYLSRNVEQDLGRALEAKHFRPSGGVSATFSKAGQSSAAASGMENRAFRILVLVAVGLSGFAALACEVVWTRVLSLVIGSSVYAFATMLCAFLCGIALGSLVFARFGEQAMKSFGSVHGQARGLDSGNSAGLALIGLVQAGIGISVLLLIPVFGVLPSVFLRMFGVFHNSFFGFQFVQFLLGFSVILIPATLFGITFPLAGKIYALTFSPALKDGSPVLKDGSTSPPAKIGQSIGSVYAANTIGAIGGSVLAGFSLIPFLGLQGTMTVVGVVSIGLAILLLSSGLKENPWARGALVAFLVFFTIPYVFAVPSWNKSIITSGVYLYAPSFLEKDISRRQSKPGIWKRLSEEVEVLYYREGIHFTVAVKKQRESGILTLSIDGKTDASNNVTRDMRTQVLLGHLPLLVNPEAKNVLVVGLASGITLGAVSRHPVEEIDCVEIEPAMIEASKFFRKWNHSVLDDPRVRVIVNDGRNHLLASTKKYDVIISEPSNPWISGCSPLFTKEYFELVKKRLNPGGVFCQWIQVYLLSAADYKTMINTVLAVFPHVSLWHTAGGDTVIIVTPETLSIDYPGLCQRMGSALVKSDLERIGITSPLELLSRFILAEGDLVSFVKGSRINTDNHPAIEFSAPKTLYNRKAGKENFELLFRSMGTVSHYLSNFDRHFDLAQTYVKSSLYTAAEKELSSNWGTQDVLADARQHNLLGYVYFKRNENQKALREFEKAISIDSEFLETYINLSLLYINDKNYNKAVSYAQQAIKIDRCYALGHNKLGQISLAQRRFDEALKHFKKAQECDSRFVQAYINEAIVYLDFKNLPPRAIMILSNALSVKPKSAAVHYHFGRAFYRAGLSEKAAESFNRAVSLDPDYEQIVRRTVSKMKRGRG